MSQITAPYRRKPQFSKWGSTLLWRTLTSLTTLTKIHSFVNKVKKTIPQQYGLLMVKHPLDLEVSYRAEVAYLEGKRKRKLKIKDLNYQNNKAWFKTLIKFDKVNFLCSESAHFFKTWRYHFYKRNKNNNNNKNKERRTIIPSEHLLGKHKKTRPKKKREINWKKERHSDYRK